jgi:uncharacterized membrane protein
MRFSAAFAAVLLLTGTAFPVLAQDTAKTPVTGVFLTTRYPAFTIRAGEATTIDLSLHDYGRPPQTLPLSVDGLPAGWKATVLGGGQPVAAATALPDTDVPLQLKLEPAADAKPGTYPVTVKGTGEGDPLILALAVTIGEQLPAKLTATTQLPALRGTATSSFQYKISIANDSGRDSTVSLQADAPQGFETSFTEAYGSQQITAIPIQAGKSKDVQLSVTPPHNAAAGNYPINASFSGDGASAQLNLAATITGQPRLSLVGDDGRLSGSATAGESTTFNLVLHNSGSEAAQGIDLSASPPAGWKIAFDPKAIPALAAGASQPVQAVVSPAAKAIAGDYQATFRASGKPAASASAEYRITVETSTRWGLIGLAIIAAAVLIVVATVVRFGRR